MKIDYYIVNPTGNITALVETEVKKENRPEIGAAIMNIHPEVEQVGFIGKGANAESFLEMAGGEFCGNATLSTGAVLAHKSGQPKSSFSINVSGTDAPVRVDISKLTECEYSGTVVMPQMLGIQTENLEYKGRRFDFQIVRFSGISHIVTENEMIKSEAESAVKKWSADLNVNCLGIMFVDKLCGRLTPLVYSRDASTLFWESSCASGTTAAGLWLAQNNGGYADVVFSEPGGCLKIKVEPGKAPVLYGSAKIIQKLTADIQI